MVLPLPVGPVTRMMPFGSARICVQRLPRISGEAQSGEIQLDARTVEQPHHDAFAVHRGHGGDAQIDFAAAHRRLDPPVLRHPALGDIELRHDFDARGYRRLNRNGIILQNMQHTVEAEPRAQTIVARLQMDVGGLHLGGARDQIMHQPDDRRFAGEILQAADIFLVAVIRVNGPVIRPALGRAGAAIKMRDPDRHFGLGHHRRLDPAAEQECQRGYGFGVERVGHRHDHALAIILDRDDLGRGEEGDLQFVRKQRHGREIGSAPQAAGPDSRPKSAPDPPRE